MSLCNWFSCYPSMCSAHSWFCEALCSCLMERTKFREVRKVLYDLVMHRLKLSATTVAANAGLTVTFHRRHFQSTPFNGRLHVLAPRRMVDSILGSPHTAAVQNLSQPSRLYGRSTAAAWRIAGDDEAMQHLAVSAQPHGSNGKCIQGMASRVGRCVDDRFLGDLSRLVG